MQKMSFSSGKINPNVIFSTHNLLQILTFEIEVYIKILQVVEKIDSNSNAL